MWFLIKQEKYETNLANISPCKIKYNSPTDKFKAMQKLNKVLFVSLIAL